MVDFIALGMALWLTIGYETFDWGRSIIYFNSFVACEGGFGAWSID